MSSFRIYSKILCLTAFMAASIVVKGQLYSDSITVNFFLLDECKITQNMTAEINRLYTEFNSSSCQFIAYWPNFSSKPPKIEAFKEKYQLQLPCKTDYYKTKAKKMQATIAPEVVVYDEKNKKILYRGRIDNSYAKIGQRRRVITERNLHMALTQISKQEQIGIPITQAIGCFINFKEL